MTLRANDLQDLVKPVFEVDSYASKMGDDENIVVVSFSLKEEQAAKDLVEFIETGYDFVLDADNTPGEIDKGSYKVFVEIERNRKISENIFNMLDGVSKLTGIKDFRFRYHKGFKSRRATLDELSFAIPASTEEYLSEITESKADNYKTFFNKSYVDTIELFGDELIISKKYADPVGLVIKDFASTNRINESLKEKINMNDYAEILFLTKYLGDYNIMKFGNKTITMENQGHTLVVERL